MTCITVLFPISTRIAIDPSQRALILPQGGPQSVNAYQGLWSKLTKEFPNAEIVASTFDNFTDILQSKRATLPRLSKEIGDTWVRKPPRAPDQQLSLLYHPTARSCTGYLPTIPLCARARAPH